MTARLEPADAILAVDMGNSQIGLAVWDDDGMHHAAPADTARPESWRAALSEAWKAARDARRRVVVIASVCPEQARDFGVLAEDVCGVEVLHIRDDVPLPMPLEVDNPREVGVDRICAAAAAYQRFETACAVASFGTAITIDCVSTDGRFLGGAILPGLQMSCDALHENTKLLPRVQAVAPSGTFGKNTHDAIVSGVAYGAAGALREIVEGFATELGVWPKLIVTGGAAPIVQKLADYLDAVVPDLCLSGIALAYRRAAESK